MIRYNRKQDSHINKKPVSIIITAWQTSQFIEDCLDSIESQTYFADNDNFEVLVGIDGCGQTLKKVGEIAHKYRNLRLFMMEKNVGTYVTSNTLLNLASKDHIIRFDSDDIMLPEMVAEIMSQTDNYDFIQYGFKTFTGNKSQTFERKFWAACGSVYYNRSFIDAAGGYKPWLCSADLELIRRTENSPFRRGVIEKRLFLLRSHPNSLASKADTKLGGGYRSGLERGIRVFKPNENIKIERKISGIKSIGYGISPDNLKVEDAKSGVFNKELRDEIKNEAMYPSPTKNTQGISILVTAWQTQNYIEKCLDSIEDQIYFKNNNNYEILLGIDGCQDTLAKVKEIKEKYRNLRVFMMEENVGTYVTTNTLLDLVSYDNIIRFDSDDYMLPHMISEVMAASEEYDFIRFHFDDFDDLRKEIRPRAFLAMGAVYYKKWVIESAGGYKDWKCNADLELLKRIGNSAIQFGEIKRPLFVRRIHPNSLSEKSETGIRSFFRKNLTNRVRIYDKGEDIKIEKAVGKYREIYAEKNIPISIIVTAWKTQDYIEECLDSIENQTYFKENDNFEVLVGVDGCPDTLNKLQKISHKYRNLRIFMMKDNKGTYVTSNTLLDLVKYENILRFDSDDVMMPELIEKTLQKIEKYDVVRLNYVTFTKNISINVKNNYVAAFGTAMFKKSVFDLAGGYRDWRCSGDYELLTRIEKHIKIGQTGEAMFYRRDHPNSLSNAADTSLKSALRARYNSQVRSGGGNVKFDKVVNKYEEINDKQSDLKHKIKYTSKPKISLVYDAEGWAFYNKSYAIKKYLSDFYDFDIVKFDEPIVQDDYNIVVCFSTACFHNNLKHYNNVLCGITSHTRLQSRLSALNKFDYSFANDFKLFNILKNKHKYYTPNGVDTDIFSTTSPRDISKKREISIATVGSAGRRIHKGEERLKLISKKLKELGYNVVNKSIFINAKIGKKLSQEEMVQYYKTVDIYIVSSESEATPNPLLEAMALGIPCISNNTGMAHLLIKNDETGYVIEDYNDIDSYVKYISKLIDEPTIYNKISKNTLQKIKDFDWSKMVWEYKRMFDDYLGIKDLQDDVTILIKTFDRPNCLHSLISSIRSFYNKIHIVVINDGSSPIKIEESNIKVINLQYDSGISKGRNEGVKEVKTKYFLICDDDFLFTKKTKIENLYSILEKTTIDILGGHVNSNGIHAGMFSLENGQILNLDKGYADFDKENNFYVCDFIRNFFMARTEYFIKNNIKWDEDLKIGEHILFYYNLKQTLNTRIAYSPDVIVENLKQIPSKNYENMRRRADTFTNKYLSKYKLTTIKRNKIIINEAKK